MNSRSFSNLATLALAVRDQYGELQQADGHKQWNVQDRTAGFVGDVGDLSKLVMAKHGIRRGPKDIDVALAHELSDCLWSVIVIADELNIDLEQAFIKTMDELQARIAEERSSINASRLVKNPARATKAKGKKQ